MCVCVCTRARGRMVACVCVLLSPFKEDLSNFARSDLVQISEEYGYVGNVKMKNVFSLQVFITSCSNYM